MKTVHKTKKVAKADNILSQAVEANGFIFVSGQIGVDKDWKIADGGIEAETKQAMENIRIILEKADSSLDSIVKTAIYVTDLSNGPVINEIYSSYFSDILPAREMVEVKALPLGAQIEISVIASK